MACYAKNLEETHKMKMYHSGEKLNFSGELAFNLIDSLRKQVCTIIGCEDNTIYYLWLQPFYEYKS